MLYFREREERQFVPRPCLAAGGARPFKTQRYLAKHEIESVTGQCYKAVITFVMSSEASFFLKLKFS
jgi:hypothetical protein